MKKEIKLEQPIAHICINKSRVKTYNKETEPTVYLAKQTEFQIELFNPTSDVILAKIHMNGKVISQGGLVLNPGQRVFLDRYLDVAQKFLFDTYEVANTNEVKKAIEDNGDIKIEFYKEKQFGNPITLTSTGISTVTTPDWTYRPNIMFNTGTGTLGGYNSGIDPKYLSGSIGTVGGSNITSTSSNAFYSNTNGITFDGPVKFNSSVEFSDEKSLDIPNKRRLTKKSIETGRVEKGSHSDQEFKYVNKSFDYLPFHTLEYKLLPISQKVNTLEDISVKRYCTDCGSKTGKTDKFCSNCGKRI